MESYLRSTDPVLAPYTTIPNLLQKWANEDPNRLACIIYNKGNLRKTITYGELYNKSDSLAKGLVRYGIQQGDVVGVGGNNTAEFLICIFAIQMTRAKPLHLTFHMKDGSDLKRMMQLVGNCKMIMFDPGEGDRHLKIVRNFMSIDPQNGQVTQCEIPDLKLAVLHSPPTEAVERFTLQDLYNDGNDVHLPQIDPDDTAAILSTSGSTGFPKAVEFSHFSILLNGYNIHYLLQTESFDKTELVYFNGRPFYWMGGYPHWEIVTGGTRITQSNSFSPTSASAGTNYVIEILQKERPFCASFGTPMLQHILHRQDIHIKIRSVMTGSQPVPSTCLDGLGKIFDSLAVAYGATELGFGAGQIYTASSILSQKYLGVVPLSGVDLKVVDHNGLIVKLQASGEVYIRTPVRFQGYVNNEEKTKNVIMPCGWYKTDDYAYINADNSLVVSGRISDVMEISGAKVAPFVIEVAMKKQRCHGRSRVSYQTSTDRQ
ncbi:fatty-acyl-CoA synthase [Mytilus galloprovincialis]|uniref:Fatty-acyl-CoA synthase n=1 Tax=Mytilus galloprovincialis TaxID=29158 RepID=A0A8B6C158_MYTGA|nr:fatty-acyl-CoA synthase [Mytilus galloprovincialis]